MTKFEEDVCNAAMALSDPFGFNPKVVTALAETFNVSEDTIRNVLDQEGEEMEDAIQGNDS